MPCSLRIYIHLFVVPEIVKALDMEEYKKFLIDLLDDELPTCEFNEIREEILCVL